MNRNIHDHIAEICEIAREGVTVTVFVAEARLGGLQYRRLVNRAVTAGLLDRTGDIYRTTELGEAYISAYRKVQRLLKEN